MKLSTLVSQSITIDFETEPIRPRPDYPPQPVGACVHWPRTKARYYTGKEMVREVKRAFASKLPLLFHNAPFDIDVAVEHCGVKRPSPKRVLDTVPMLFLLDPHADFYALKPSAELHLGLPPEERDAVIDWLVENQPLEGVKLSDKPKSKHYAGAYISLAPPSIVGPYCIGDVERTRKLARKLAVDIERRGMREAYVREMRVQYIVGEMEREGVRVSTSKLRRDEALYTKELEKLDRWLRRKLKVAGDFNLDAKEKLAHALVDVKLADPTLMERTKTGKLSAAKDSLKAGITDKQVYAALRWRGAVGTCLQTFIRPWLAQAKRNRGRVYVKWNSIRRDHAKGGGTRTGRFSSSPNLQNVPKVFEALFVEHLSKFDQKILRGRLPKVPLKGLPSVPEVRSYIVAEEGHVLLDRDFSSQELRVLAYFEDDDIARAFAANPNLDLHQKVADDLCISRRAAKTINFAILYGVGHGHLAEMLGISMLDARKIKTDYFNTYPSVRELIDDLKALAKLNEPIVTWGGRQYYCEPPRYVDGRLWDFSYKLLNYLIQGSSADLTKQTMIELKERIPDLRIIATVHDEFLVSAPKKDADRTMQVMREVMAINWLKNVPMTSTGKRGANWASMKECV